MFFRVKTSGGRQYLQLVENSWEQGRTRQRVLATLGRLDQLQQSGQLDALLASGARLTHHSLLLTAHRDGQLPVLTTRRLGPPLIFERLWRLTGCQAVLEELLAERRFEFAVERAVFLTVLHRLCAPGSDRAADRWKVDYVIDGSEALQLHQLYRAMAWLGEVLPAEQQQGSTRLVERCTKDLIEEGVFARRRDLFTELDLVFFDSLFISLARANKIPAKFEIGFALPENRGGEVAGYHCWAKFRVEGKGWVPVDVSEANRNPKKVEYYFGNLTEDRVTFSVGRDVTLAPMQDGEPLNFFVYPHVEVGGKPYPADKLKCRFLFKDVE